MQSSYNVIKNDYVMSEGKQEISTKVKIDLEDIEETSNSEENQNDMLLSFQNMADDIIKNAKVKSNMILVEATENAKNLEEQAKVEGYEKGYNEGYEKGYSVGYNEGYEKSKADGQAIIDNALNVLEDAKKEYIKYVEEKEIDFRNLIINCIKETLKREVKDEDALNNMIYDVMEKEKNEDYFTIRCNKNYKESLESEKQNMASKLAFQGDIFIVEDNSLEDGSAIIEKKNGTSYISIDNIIKKLSELIMER
ncbi:DivIVA domain-containing protein [Clostridium ihumii]|uniref:DivIVA domain-containing protein n=1 Tax=Clostridium ihumii TaxID=1470356 RepID=UPI003D34BAE8